MRRTCALLLTTSLLVLLLVSGVAGPASAGDPEETLVVDVTTANDVVDGGDGQVSLREAVSIANASPLQRIVINLLPGAEHVLDRCGGNEDTNAQGDLDLTGTDQFIDVEGQGATIRQTCAGERVLHVLLSDLDVDDTTITGGRSTGGAPEGGGVRLEEGSLRLDRSTLVDNRSGGSGGGAWGGGANSDLDVIDSVVADNVSDASGGGVWAQDEVFSIGSTFQSNVAENFGGAMWAGSNARIRVSTIVGNEATELGGAAYSPSNIELSESTVVGNDAGDAVVPASLDAPAIASFLSVVAPGSGIACSSDAASDGGSYDTDGTCGFDDAPTDVSDGADPQLGPLQDNGGVTPTMAPAPSSPVVDLVPTGGQFCEEDGMGFADQRGVGRPQGAGCDAGAVESPLPFSDVGLSSPFFDEIVYLEAQGITGGYDDGTFRPNGSVSRQAIAAFLYRLSDTDTYVPGPPQFSDVPLSHPFFTEIDWMVQNDITTGYPGGTFRPGASVTRQAIAAFLYRVADATSVGPPTATFSDVGTDHPFFDEIEWLAEVGLTTGYQDGTYRPGNTMTRQAMAAFLYRAAEQTGIFGQMG